jgi:hypothetical protein
MAMFGALSTYWCGDIIYRIEFVASVFTRASILIAWDPYNYSGTPPSFGDAVSILKNVTVQIVGNTAIDLRIPYKSYMPALLCGSLSAPNAADNEAFSNGTIYFFVVNPVQDNGSATPTMYMNVYARSDNMTFFAPSLDGNLDYTLDAEPYSNDFCPAANVDFGPKTDLSNIHTRIVGDSPRTVKDYALRMNKVTSGNVTGNNTGAINSLQLSSPNMPLTINDRTSTSATHNSYFAWMSSGFLGYRGSVRYSLKAWYTISPVSNTLIRFSYGVYHQTHGISAAAFVATAQHTSGNDLENAYAFTHMQDGISNRLDVAAPIIIPTDFLATRVQPNSSTDSLNFIATVEGSDGNLTSSAINYNLYQGCGDDGVFLWFLGFPMTTN